MSSEEYPGCLPVSLLESAPDIVPERRLPRSVATDFSAARGEESFADLGTIRPRGAVHETRAPQS